jgi:hypothetical protein
MATITKRIPTGHRSDLAGMLPSRNPLDARLYDTNALYNPYAPPTDGMGPAPPQPGPSLASMRDPLMTAFRDQEPREREPGRGDPVLPPSTPPPPPTSPGGGGQPPPVPDPTTPPPTTTPGPTTPPPAPPPTTGQRRVPISGREDTANLWGIHNPEIWTNPDAPDLNRRALRVLMRYPATTDGVRQAMQDPDWLADPDLARATFSGDTDRINFHGALSGGDRGGVPVNEVDVLAAWVRETGQSQGFRWGDVDAMQRGTPPPTPQNPVTPTTGTPTRILPDGTVDRSTPRPNPTQQPGPDGVITYPDGGNRPLAQMRDPAAIVPSNAMQTPTISQEPYRKLVSPLAETGMPLNQYARLGRRGY